MIEHGIIMNFLIFMALIISLTSCQPVDKEINNSRAYAMADSADSSAVNYRYASITLDRAVESLHLLKAVLSSDYASKNSIAISESANQKVISYGSENGTAKKRIIMTKDYKHQAQLTMNIEMNLNSDQTLESLQFKNTDQSNIEETFFIYKSGKVNDKSDVSVKNFSRIIKIKKKASENKYIVEQESVDQIDIFRTGQVISISSFSMEINWDGKADSLEQPIIITKLDLVSNRLGQKALAKFVSESTLSLSLKDVCPSVNGTLKLTDNKTNQSIEMSAIDSTISFIPIQKIVPAVTCGVRPVVDLRKLSSFH